MSTRRAILALTAGIAGFSTGPSATAHSPKKRDGATASPPEQMPWGIAGDPKSVTRTLSIDMLDTMRFSPDRLAVREGETLRLRVRNRGRVLHELVLGTRDALDAHAALMLKFPAMEHDEPYMSHVAAGRTGELVWNFNRPGAFEFACLVPGHFQAGMRGTVQVSPRRA